MLDGLACCVALPSGSRNTLRLLALKVLGVSIRLRLAPLVVEAVLVANVSALVENLLARHVDGLHARLAILKGGVDVVEPLAVASRVDKVLVLETLLLGLCSRQRPCCLRLCAFGLRARHGVSRACSR